ncbi:MAG: phosphoribosylanthranilate isomerase [Deltaproteobacteria bacterium]|nr:phosphoribosylanthranilate isomerase [Deltaproteobacteria bacterium]
MKGPYTEIKICGITRLEDALCAVACGADAVGFIFNPASPRCTTPEKARAIITELPKRIATVGVFVNETTEIVERTTQACGLDLIQLHGDESPAYCRYFPPERIIKAVSPGTPEALRALEAYQVRALLIDARDRNRYGGTGLQSDWNFAVKIRERRPLILAGGLHPGNIGEALAFVVPQAVDINSGCELAPGIKDHELMRRIIGMVRGMNQGAIHSGRAPRPINIFENFVKDRFPSPMGRKCA